MCRNLWLVSGSAHCSGQTPQTFQQIQTSFGGHVAVGFEIWSCDLIFLALKACKPFLAIRFHFQTALVAVLLALLVGASCTLLVFVFQPMGKTKGKPKASPKKPVKKKLTVGSSARSRQLASEAVVLKKPPSSSLSTGTSSRLLLV